MSEPTVKKPAPELITLKYRLIFLPDAEYAEILSAIKPEKRSNYLVLSEKGIDNFSIGNGQTVFIPERHRAELNLKAKRGENI